MVTSEPPVGSCTSVIHVAAGVAALERSGGPAGSGAHTMCACKLHLHDKTPVATSTTLVSLSVSTVSASSSCCALTFRERVERKD